MCRVPLQPHLGWSNGWSCRPRSELVDRLATLLAVGLAWAPAASAGSLGLTGEIVPSTGTAYFSIASGPDGRMWTTERSAKIITAITTGGTATNYLGAQLYSTGPQGIAAGPDGNLWYTQISNNRIGPDHHERHEHRVQHPHLRRHPVRHHRWAGRQPLVH